ncbi:Adenylosuccinate lyase [Candidatus Magnetoovum chiemensis]|nr:Adenylosuccinate lyase [Candidatus Magnetoovum chiemensis]
MKEAANIIIKDILNLLYILKEQALTYKDLPCMGRTHGVHAEPMSLGLKFALWYEEMRRNIKRMETAKETISVGKISGAVGTFSTIPPIIEEIVCAKLGLTPEPIATQIVQRDRHAQYMLTLSLIACTIDKISTEIRHLQRTEVRELEEHFGKGQKGSSAMPHKRNPIGCENLSGLSRIVRANALAALENITLWHERDISHSSAERIIIPDSTTLVNYMLVRLKGIIKSINVLHGNIANNLSKSFGLYNSQKVLLALIDKGVSRQDAYSIVQELSMQSWEQAKDFKELLKQTPKIKEFLFNNEIDKLFEISDYLKNIAHIYNRVFG